MTSMPIGLNKRIMTLRLETPNNEVINLISAYVPIMKASEEAKEEFYELLNSTIEEVPPKEKLLLLGDFNARVGQNCETWRGIIGKHGLCKSNLNGILLLSHCVAHGLAITNTMFKTKEIRKGTWMHPRSRHWHQIDHIITREAT